MSMSLREQLLQAGLVSQKQVKDVERQRERQARQSKHPRGAAALPEPARPAPGAKTARDQELNRQQQEKAREKALLSQIKQLIEQNRLPPIEGEDFYHFVDGNKVRRLAVNAQLRGALSRGEVVVVRHAGRYDLVPAALAVRIRERDARAVIAGVAGDAGDAGEPSPTDNAYKEFPVPDDLMW